jgi:hypothetical protein
MHCPLSEEKGTIRLLTSHSTSNVNLEKCPFSFVGDVALSCVHRKALINIHLAADVECCLICSQNRVQIHSLAYDACKYEIHLLVPFV